jgi:hypothetical protein
VITSYLQKGHQRSAFHRRRYDFISINVNYCGYLVLDHQPTPVGKYRNRPRVSLRLSLIRTVLSHDEATPLSESGDRYWECKTIANRTGSRAAQFLDGGLEWLLIGRWGTQFEISVDGKPRSYRDTKAMAIQSADYLKQRQPHSKVTVKELKSGEVTVVAWKPAVS